MDVTAVSIMLHPLAEDYLFKHYQVLRRIFSDVLGHLETDYISIALIDKHGQLIFLSSKPSIEQNLIDKKLWFLDGSYHPNFIYQDQPNTWANLNCVDSESSLYHYKQEITGLKTGFSMPTNFGEYRAVFSFGIKHSNQNIQEEIFSKHRALLAMGKFCLQEIIKVIPLPNQQKIYKFKPHLELVINNQVNYEKTT